MKEFALIYLIVGAILAIRHISSGKVGEVGKLGTFIAYALLWPAFVIMK